ncbi:hypothetical protein PSU4_01340 [Pseudonocardia sulfidoxydans NBRC 16205]|uniref:DUF5698 domain-containing protein n=1 Tax=Pseudonocardia sulfidoxydans NBRC 16205 TaxID=1223511 RepID=A0A511D8Q3_9PSEU|nr:DUF5698 domain-containing protein [Pseudonocardia sulfidoxydans]GEL21180.1 hypothetical protein PSU4_01340 [Pseudonocardia sulfidoxydans NBRC 16205]
MSIAFLQPLAIAALVVLEVGVWQVRMAVAARGRRRAAAVLGALGAVIQVVALAQVVTDLDNPANVAGYAVGVAAGVYLGVGIGGRLAADPVEHRVVVTGDGAEIAAQLRARGRPVTTQPAVGVDGPATILFVVACAGADAEVARELRRLAPDGFHTSSVLRSASATPLPLGFVQVAAARAARAAARPELVRSR